MSRHYGEFDLAEDLDILLCTADGDDGEDEDHDERPVSRMQFYPSSDSESSSCPSSPETVILNDNLSDDEKIVLDDFEDLCDSALPDLLPVSPGGVYYEASVIVKSNIVSVSDVDAFNDNTKFPFIYEVMKSLDIFHHQIRTSNAIIVELLLFL